VGFAPTLSVGGVGVSPVLVERLFDVLAVLTVLAATFLSV
jgi:hypothetical protein